MRSQNNIGYRSTYPSLHRALCSSRFGDVEPHRDAPNQLSLGRSREPLFAHLALISLLSWVGGGCEEGVNPERSRALSDMESSARDASLDYAQRIDSGLDAEGGEPGGGTSGDEGVIDEGVSGAMGGDGGGIMWEDVGVAGEIIGDAEVGPPPWSPPLGERPGHFKVRVLLDQQPMEAAVVSQGGAAGRWETDERGEVWVTLDQEAIPPFMVFGAHSEARTRGEEVSVDQREGVTISLTRFSHPEQPAYPFSDPGEPRRRETTSQCGHCHLNINDEWFASPHRSSARNPIVYDLYTGRGSGWQDEESCTDAGGRWRVGPFEGGGDPREQCYFEISALGAFNADCVDAPCDPSSLGDDAYFGGCADCHAPAVNGLSGGGHDLLSVEGRAFEYGVSCDLCHHVESVRLAEPAGVGGRLVLHRPRERASVTLGGGGYLPLSFGPHEDVANPRMGISPRAHFRDGSLCGGCHQHQHDDVHALYPIDSTRWPSGRLPNQSTYAEWREGPLGVAESASERVACNACHMTPNPAVMNSANLERFPDADIGVQGGWPRPLGETRAHAWWGPRQPLSSLLEMSAGVSMTSPQLIPASEGAGGDVIEAADSFEVNVVVTNLGAGHGLPTGEPMRHLILIVEARCGDVELEAVGGDAVHALGGALEVRSYDEATAPWPNAQVGDALRVVRPLDEPYEYDGYGPFRDPAFDAERGISSSLLFTAREKGLFREEVIGVRYVTEVRGSGELILSAPLPGQAGDRVYLTRSAERAGRSGPSYAGHSGFSFARVLLDQANREMTPHFIATDLVRDNRLRPGRGWNTRHRFSLTACPDPASASVTARLIYRPYPLWLARERGWTMWDREVRRATRHLSTSMRGAWDDPPTFGARWSVPQEALNDDERAALALPSSWVTAALDLESLPTVLVSVAPNAERDATRRGEATPWRVRLLGEEAEAPEVLPPISLPARLMNLSPTPLALEPIEGVTVMGASLENMPPPLEVLRSAPSLSPSLWVIPPRSGVTLVPSGVVEPTALLAAGYTEHGGRSWVPLSPLFEVRGTPDQASLTLLESQPRPPLITRAASPDPTQGLDVEVWRWSYQGSPRAERWRLMSDQEVTERVISATEERPLNTPARLLVVRNLSATAMPLEVEGGYHWRWRGVDGWSDPITVSWIPIHGEAVIAIPALSPGMRRVGALETPELSVPVRFD